MCVALASVLALDLVTQRCLDSSGIFNNNTINISIYKYRILWNYQLINISWHISISFQIFTACHDISIDIDSITLALATSVLALAPLRQLQVALSDTLALATTTSAWIVPVLSTVSLGWQCLVRGWFVIKNLNVRTFCRLDSSAHVQPVECFSFVVFLFSGTLSAQI